MNGMYNIFIDIYGKAGKIKEAIEIFEEMPQHVAKRDLFTFATIINCLGKSNNFEKMFFYYEKMQEEKIKPNRIIFTSMFHSLGRAGKFTEMTQILDQMQKVFKLGTYEYNCILHCYSSFNKIQEIKDLFNEMKQKSIPMDYYTLTIYVCALGKNKMFSDLAQLYNDEIENQENFKKIQENQKQNAERALKQKHRKSRAGSEDVVLDDQTHLFTAFLKQFSEIHTEENSAYFLQVLRKLEKEGVKKDLQCYHIIIKHYIDTNQVNLGLNYYNEMISNSIYPNEFIYSSLIFALAKQNRIPEIFKIYQFLIEKFEKKENYPIPFPKQTQSVPPPSLPSTPLIIENNSENNNLTSAKIFTPEKEKEIQAKLDKLSEQFQSFQQQQNSEYESKQSIPVTPCKTTEAKNEIEAKTIELKFPTEFPLEKSMEEHSIVQIPFFSFIISFAKLNQVEEMFFFYEEMKKFGYLPNNIILTSMITSLLYYHTLAQRNQLPSKEKKEISEKIQHIIDQLDHSKLAPETYYALISYYGQVPKNVKKMEAFYNEFKSKFTEENEPIYNSLIISYTNSHLVDKLYDFYVESKNKALTGVNSTKVPLSCCANFIFAFGKLGEIEKMMEIFYELKKFNYISSENLLIYNSLISAFSKFPSRTSEINAIVSEMNSRKIPFDLKTYNSLIHFFGKIHNFSEMIYHYEKLVRSSIQPDIVTFLNLISAFGGAGRLLEMEFYFTELKKHKLQPTIVVLQSILQSYSKHNEEKKMLKLFNSLESEYGLIPTTRWFNEVISYYAARPRVSEMLFYFNEMKKNSYPTPDVHTYNALLKGFSAAGQLAEMVSHYNKMISLSIVPNHSTFFQLLSAFVLHQKFKQVPKILDEMVKYAVEFNEYMFQSIQALYSSPEAHPYYNDFLNHLKLKSSENPSWCKYGNLVK